MDTPGMLPVFNRSISEDNELNQWLFSIMLPYIKGRILLVGKDSAAFSSFLIEQAIPFHISVSEADDQVKFREKYSGNDLVRGVHALDFKNPGFVQEYSLMLGAFGTIILSTFHKNFYNESLLCNIKLLLGLRRCVIIIMPSPTVLYNGFQLSLEDWKKIDRGPLKQFLNDYQLLKTRHFHLATEDESSIAYYDGIHVLAIASKIR